MKPAIAVHSVATGNFACRVGGASVPVGAGELAFQCSKGGDHFGCFECAVAPTDGDLAQDVGIDEPLDCLGGRLEGASDERGGAVDGKNRGARETPEEEVCSQTWRGWCQAARAIAVRARSRVPQTSSRLPPNARTRPRTDRPSRSNLRRLSVRTEHQ